MFELARPLSLWMVRLPSVLPTLVLVALAALVACEKKSPQEQQPSSQATVDYAPRIGIAVATGTRSCVAIQNSTLQPGAPLTVVIPSSPQSFIETQVTGQSASPCPITQDVNPAMNSYDIKSSAAPLPKQMPMIAIVGPASQLSMENVSVQAKLDQDGSTDTFSACGADDGVHLSVWKGRPFTGTPIWKGYYYESGNPGTLPACTTANH